MKTPFTILHTNGQELRTSCDLPEEPSFEQIKRIVQPFLGDPKLEPMEHVTVMVDGERRDMFVSEYGAMATGERGVLPINRKATEIYRRRGPAPEPPFVHGVAVLFSSRQVWF